MIDKVREILDGEASKMVGFKNTGNGFILYDKQVAAITALKYKLKYSRAHLFNFILKLFPGLKDRLTAQEIKYYKVSALYKLLDASEKSMIIKKMDLIKKNKNAAC